MDLYGDGSKREEQEVKAFIECLASGWILVKYGETCANFNSLGVVLEARSQAPDN